MTMTETTVPAIEIAKTLEELDDQVKADASDDADFPVDYDEEDAEYGLESARVEANRTEPAVATTDVDAKVAELQALVPWKVLPPDRYTYGQQKEIETWADDFGHYPRRYRSYTREEWREAIGLLATTVSGLVESHPDYQHRTGLYVEEQTDDFLLIRGKYWQLLISITGKASASAKKIELGVPPGRDNWSMTSARPGMFAELLTEYVQEEHRDTLLDICCQYLKEIRVLVNKKTWAATNPDLAHLVDEK